MVLRKLDHVKPVKSKGKIYHYFDTGAKNEEGKPIRRRLPNQNDPSYMTVYTALLTARNKRTALAPAAMSIGKLVDLYLKSPKITGKGLEGGKKKVKPLAPATVKEYTRVLDKAVDMLMPAPADGIEPHDIVLLHDQLADSPAMANQTVRILSALFAWAVKRGHVSKNPCVNIEFFEGGEHEPWPEALLEKALKAEDAFVRRAVHLLYYTGQRVGDVRMMTRGAIEGDYIPVTQQKTSKPLMLRIHADLAAELERGEKHPALLYDPKRGCVPNRDQIRRDLQAWAVENGCDPENVPVPHGIKKNATNALLDVGCDLAQISAVTGNSLQLVEHYAKARDQRRHATAAVLKWEKRG